jgi:hypothetical protein
MATVYRFRSWDPRSDCYQLSQRWATAERIAKLGGEAASDGVEVPDDTLGKVTSGEEVEGMLARGASPHPRDPHRFT